MPILGLHLLPPFSLARFGSSAEPLEAFDLRIASDEPLGYREICPQATLVVDPRTGEIARSYVPERIRFRDGEAIRPVAPFLEVFAKTAEDTLEPLTLDLLTKAGLAPDSVHWRTEVGNLKMFRQTHDSNDKVLCTIASFNDHEVHELRGLCPNFLDGKYVPFGSVRYIKPTPEFPQIRLRFTPGPGKVYGASLKRFDLKENAYVDDPVFKGSEERIVYDEKRGTWRGFRANWRRPDTTNPSDIYHSYYDDPNELGVSRGYLDDVCDGFVCVTLKMPDGMVHVSRAWISSGMPDFAPDSDPVRTVADELEQAILGPEIDDEEVSIDAAAEIVRRSLETVRLMNTAAMNSNTINGRSNIARTLVTQDSNDYGRLFAPIFASSLVDNLAVRRLHERVFAALRSGSVPWFSEVLRRPEDIGDLSDQGRRKMPAMLRGSDSRALTLTRRQISTIVKAAVLGVIDPKEKTEASR